MLQSDITDMSGLLFSVIQSDLLFFVIQSDLLLYPPEASSGYFGLAFAMPLR